MHFLDIPPNNKFCQYTSTVLIMARVYQCCFIRFEMFLVYPCYLLCLILIVHRCPHTVLPTDSTITRSAICRHLKIRICMFDKRKVGVIYRIVTRILITGICTVSHVPA